MSLELPPNQLGSAGLTTNPASATQDMDGYKITDLATPTQPSDAVTKAYADALVISGGASTWSQYPATQNVNMAGYNLNSAGNVNGLSMNAVNDVTAGNGSISLTTTASSIANKANLTGANNTFTNSQQFNGDNFLVGSSSTPIADTFEIHAQDVNLRAHGTTDVLNITSFAATVIAAGGAVNITGGASSSLYAAVGTVGVGGPINHIIVDGNDINSVGDIECATITATGEIDANSLTVGDGGTILGGLLTDTLQVAAITASSVVNLAGATSVTVPTPTTAQQAATKAYVDSAVGTGGAGLNSVNTFTATNNFTGTASDFNIGTLAVPTNSVNVFTDDINMTSSDATKGISLQASGPIQILGVGQFPNAPSTVSIGGSLNSVSITGNAITCGQINSGEIFPTSVTATGVVSAATVNGTFVAAGGLTCSGVANFTGTINVPTPTLSTQAATKAYVDAKTAAATWTTVTATPIIFNGLGAAYAMGQSQVIGDTIITFQVNTTGTFAPGAFSVTLPGPCDTLTPGTMIQITNTVASKQPLRISGAAGGLYSPWRFVDLYPGGSMIFTLVAITTPENGSFGSWIQANNFASISLSGTEADQPVTGPVVFQSGTANLACDDIRTSLISANEPFDFITVTDPIQIAAELGVRSADGVVPAKLLMALSESAAPANTLEMSYDPNGADALEVNKDIIANGVNLNEAIAFKDANEFFVSANGSDTTGNGSANAPFATIQKAITTAEAALSSNMVINVAAGEYNENLTITKGHIMIKGDLQSDRSIEGVILSGKITINITDVDNLHNNQVILAGFFLSGQIEDVSTKKHTVIVNGMRIEADSAINGSAIIINGTTAGDQRTIVQNCIITQEADMTSTSALVAVNVGWLIMSECDLSVRTTGSCIAIGGTALISRLLSCALDNSNTSSSATQLVTITSTTTTPHNIAQTSFAMSSSTAKTDAPAIRATTAVPQTIVLGQNAFAIAGTTAASEVVKFTLAPTVVLLPANNRSVPNTAAAMPAGATIVPLTTVGEQFVNNIVAGENVTVNFATTNGVRTATISASGGSGGVTSVNSATGAITVAAGTNIGVATADGVITISNTAPAGVEAVVGGSGIVVNGTATEPEIINDGVLTVNSAKGAITVSAGTNIGVATVNGTITISNTAPTDFVESVTAGSGIVVGGTATDPVITNDGVLTVNSAKGAITVSAGTNIGVATVDGVITISNTAPTDFVESVIAGTGIGIGGTATNPIVNNTGVIGVTAGTGISLGGTAAEPIINATGIQAVSVGTGLATTGGTSPTLSVANTAVTAGTYTYPSITVNAQGQLTAASSLPAVSEVGAGDGISVEAQGTGVVITNSGVRSLTASTGIVVGGTANAPTVSNDGVLTVNNEKGAISLIAGSGIGIVTEGTNITFTNSSPNTGVESVVAGTGIVVDTTDPANPTVSNNGVLSVNGANAQITIAAGTNITVSTADNTVTVSAPNVIGLDSAVNSSPCTFDGFTSAVSVGSEITTSPTLIFTYTEVLATPFWRWTDKVIGFLGFLTMALNASHPLQWTSTISKNGAAHSPAAGTLYFTDSKYFTVPVNMISQITINPDTFLTYSVGDTVQIKFYAQYLGSSSNPTVMIAPQALQAIYAPLNSASTEPLPPSGTIPVTAPVTTVAPLDPANNYRFSNGLSVEATLTTYTNSVPDVPVNVAVGDTYPAVADPALTGLNGYTMTEATPSFPSSPITITAVSGMTPIGIDPTITYTFINGSATDSYVVTLYVSGQPPGPVLTEIAPGQQVVAPNNGYTGYTVALGGTPPPPDYPTSPITITEPVLTPSGLNPDIQYTFINNGGGPVYRVTGYIGGTLGQELEIPNGGSDQFAFAGFTGYTAIPI